MMEYKVKRFKTKAQLEAAMDSIPAAKIGVYGWTGGREYDASARLALAEDYGFICKMSVNEKAPAAVVEAERTKLTKFLGKKGEIETALAALSK